MTHTKQNKKSKTCSYKYKHTKGVTLQTYLYGIVLSQGTGVISPRVLSGPSVKGVRV